MNASRTRGFQMCARHKRPFLPPIITALSVSSTAVFGSSATLVSQIPAWCALCIVDYEIAEGREQNEPLGHSTGGFHLIEKVVDFRTSR